MTIKHRFIRELEELENKHISGEFNCVVIGTFNPQDGNNTKKNDADWFYGRNRNKFWHLFPSATMGISLHPSHNEIITHQNKLKEWKLFAENNRILFIDLIKEVNATQLKTFQDIEIFRYDTFSFNIEKAFKDCNIKYAVYTRSTWDNRQLKKIKDTADSFFRSKETTIIDLITPAGYYGKGNSLHTKLGMYRRDLANLGSCFKRYPNYK